MPPARRLIRRRPLMERLKAYLHPLDFLLWLSEELESSDWDQWQRDWALPIGMALNLLMLVAKANSGSRSSSAGDVFGEDDSSSGWLGWLASFVVHFLSLFAVMNAVYTFYRTRHYRLFEASVEQTPSTPSARRVRVDSSPASSSPLRYLATLITSTTAEARAHPDAERDVWELSVWDPTPICLKMFCMFSPGHVLVYWLFLPIAPQDPRPSTTVVTTMLLATLLSLQLSLLQASFSQQAKDSSLIHKEVLNEYDTKYVHPRTQPRMRDVGTQKSKRSASQGGEDSVDTYSPVIVVNRGFRTSPNPSYLSHLGATGSSDRSTPPRVLSATALNTPYRTPAASVPRELSSPTQPRTAHRQAQMRAGNGPASTGDGGSLGIYSHAHSPLKKAASMNAMARSDGYTRRADSPVKRDHGPLFGLSAGEAARRMALLREPRRESGRI